MNIQTCPHTTVFVITSAEYLAVDSVWDQAQWEALLTDLEAEIQAHKTRIAVLRRARYAAVRRGPIIDPYAGSGSTLLAAYREGLTAIGVEIEEHYCEVAARRLEADSANAAEPQSFPYAAEERQSMSEILEEHP